MNKFKTAQAAGLLAACSLLAAGAQACKECDDKAAAATTSAAAPAGDALTVVRDKETGQLRAPTAAELSNMQRRAEALQSARVGAAPAAQQPLLRSHASGARSARLTPDFSSYSVVRKNADGSLDQTCVQGHEAALKALAPIPVAQRSTTAETE